MMRGVPSIDVIRPNAPIVRVPPGSPFAIRSEIAMPKRQMDDQTRSLIDQIDERLRDAERLRHHVNNPQPHVWPDRRRSSRIPGAPREHIRDDGEDAG